MADAVVDPGDSKSPGARRPIGRSGVFVAPLSIGTMNFGVATPEAEAIRIIHQGLDAGLDVVNASDVDYSGRSEAIIAKALRGQRRDRVFLAAEISGKDMGVPHAPNLTRSYIHSACERSLRRLNTGWIDLYVVPRPNLDIPIVETLSALDELVQAGNVRHIALSTFPAWMVMEAIAVAEKNGLAPIIADQSPYNLLDRRVENELVPLAIRHEVGLLPWAPLAQGVLAGRYTDARNLPADSRAGRIGGVYLERVTEAGVAAGLRFARLAREAGWTPAQLAFAWVRDQPGVVAPMVGFRTTEHLD
ncbi:MAG TPA: aldo/keto reductase, partial [Sphingomicrobium sp.]|nr:aldo/keto reductase [Sphingomicrobium sp.]